MKSTAVIGDGRGAGFVQRDREVGAVVAVEQVDAVEARVGRRAGRSGCGCASNWVARLARTVVSEVCCAWLISACADCTSLVIEVMPLLAAWIVLMPLAIESSRLPQVAGAVAQALRREEVDRIVERGVDPLAGGKLGLGRRDQVRRLLQLQKVGPDASRKNDVTHLDTPPRRVAAARSERRGGE